MKKEEDIDQYINNFKTLTLKEKQNIIYQQLKLLSAFTNMICEKSGVENEIIVNSELADLNKEQYTEDDFAEAIIVLINSIQNSICDFHSAFADYLMTHPLK